MKKIIICLTVIIVLLVIFNNKSSAEQQNNSIAASPTGINRVFYMGFSTWPPDMDIKAIEKSFELTNQNSDIRLVHFDGGVPWVEMYQKQALPKRIQDSWNYTKSQSKGKKIFIAITPLNFERTDIALYANSENDNQPLPEEWKNLPLDNNKVKQAYLAYAETAINFWQPDYLAIGIEVNISANKNPEKWNQYLELHKFVYNELKKRHLRLPVFATIQLEHFKGITDDAKGKARLQAEITGELMKYSDIAALSVYPYSAKGAELTEDYFNDIKVFNKPLAISETGWPSQDFEVFGVTVKGSEQAQAEYLQNLLKAANQNKFMFVINWVNVDYSRLLEKLPKGAITEFAKSWVYNGLWNENFEEKPGLNVWQGYLQIERQ